MSRRRSNSLLEQTGSLGYIQLMWKLVAVVVDIDAAANDDDDYADK